MISASNPQQDNGDHDEYVNLLFRHILSKLNVTFAKAKVLQNSDVTITEVTITGLKEKGDFVESSYDYDNTDATNVVMNSGWTASTTATSTYALQYKTTDGQELNDGTYADPTDLTSFTKGAPYFFIESLVMPQVIVDDQVTLTAKYTIKTGDYTENYTYQLDLYDIAALHKFFDGFNYYLNFTIEPQVIKFDATVKTWDDQAGIAKTIE